MLTPANEDSGSLRKPDQIYASSRNARAENLICGAIEADDRFSNSWSPFVSSFTELWLE